MAAKNHFLIIKLKVAVVDNKDEVEYCNFVDVPYITNETRIPVDVEPDVSVGLVVTLNRE